MVIFNLIIRLRNFLAKSQFLFYIVIVSHPCKPKIHNMSSKFTKLAKGILKLIHHYVFVLKDLISTL